jgi:hypothetical protein
MLSYTDLAADLATANAYATARAWADWTGSDAEKEAALRRGQDYIAATYNARWADEWDNDEAPLAVQYAIIEAARRELIEPGSMAPDLERGGAVRSIKAGSVSIEYKDSAPAVTAFPVIEGLLSGLLMPASASVALLRV